MLHNTMPNAAPAPAPTTATRVFPTSIVGCNALTDISTGKLAKYQLVAILPNETTPRHFDLSIDSYEAKKANPALVDTLEFHVKDCVDKKGKPFVSHWAFMSGYSRLSTTAAAW